MATASGVEAMVRDGAAAAVAALAEAAPVPAEQLALDDLEASEAHLALPDAGEVLAIAAELGGDMHQAVAEFRRRAGKGGRKLGAKGRRSEELARYLGQFGPDPLVQMTRAAARPVELLAAELGCSKIEAAEFQRKCWAELAPYLHGKKPVSVQLDARGHMTLILPGAPVDGGRIQAASFADVPTLNIAAEQPLSGAAAGQSE